MEELFAYGSLEGNPKWSCREINLTYSDLQSKHLRRPIIGSIYIFMGVIFQLCYILALSVICSREFLQLSCYKLMMCLGLLDFICTIFSSEISGFLYIMGAEYCMYPYLQYISGCVIVGCFASICALSLFLVMNRLIDFWQPRMATKLFRGNKTWAYIVLCLIYGLICFWKAPTVVFNVDFGAWLYHPLIPGKMKLQYTSLYQTVNNVVTSSGMCTAYLGIVILHAYKLKETKMIRRSTLQKKILIQAICVCFFTFTTTTLWASMIFYEPSQLVLYLGQLSWHLMHGVPSLVYLFLNKTIQRRALRNLSNLMNRKKRGVNPISSFNLHRSQEESRTQPSAYQIPVTNQFSFSTK